MGHILFNIGANVSLAPTSEKEIIACRFEVDISTPAILNPIGSSVLPPESLGDVFSELVALGVEILENGDVL